MATVQAIPVFLNRDNATVEKVVELTAKAATEGAGLIVFPEAFIPTYPYWVWPAPAWSDWPFYERLAAESVTVPSAATERMGTHSSASDRVPAQTVSSELMWGSRCGVGQRMPILLRDDHFRICIDPVPWKIPPLFNGGTARRRRLFA